MLVVFGEDEDPTRLERLGELMTGLATAGQRPVGMIPWLRHDLGPWSPMGMFMKVRERVDRGLYDEIRLRRERGGLDERNDVLSLMLQARTRTASP